MQKKVIGCRPVLSSFFRVGSPFLKPGVAPFRLPVQMRRIMKLTFFLLFACCVHLSAKTFSQDISLSVRDAPLKSVFKAIKKQSGFVVLYNQELLEKAHPVSLSVSKMPLATFLEALFRDQPLNFRIDDRTIFLSEKKEPLSTTPVFQPAAAATLRAERPVTGVVRGQDGQVLAGASVKIKGTNKGAYTGVDGEYTLTVSASDRVLVFSFVGFLTQEAVIGNQEVINVTLRVDSIGLEDVVLIGYGSDKKVNLTGAIGSITNKQIEYKNVMQTSQVLQGEISGVTVETNTGSPGRDLATIRIRGIGTFSNAGKNPLVLVDGIPSSLDNLNPNSIQSISVLKDAASASIYGSRAANGVILIETKKGKMGKLSVNYNGYVGRQKPTEMPEFVPAWEYAELQNEFLINSGEGAIWTPQDIQKFRSGEDPVNYPNVDHYKDLFSSGNGFQTGHDLSFTGGSENINYFFSTGYVRQDGLIQENSFKRNNILLNLSSKISEKLELNIGLTGDISTIDEPSNAGAAGDMGNIILGSVRLPVIYPGRLPDGTYGWINVQHPEASLDSYSFQNDKKHHFLGNASLKWKVFNGFSLSGKIGYDMNDGSNVNYNATMVLDPTRTLEPAQLHRTRANNNETIFEVLAVYEKSVRDHNIGLLAGYTSDEFRNESLYGYRDNFPTNSLYELNAGAAGNMRNTGDAYEWSLLSYFGRINYNYQGKYLFEANARYDGSSRFSREKRWGFFPSFSAGWRISEENFLQNSMPWINNLKLRASWGSLGNQQIGNYPYQPSISLGQNYPFGVSPVLASGAMMLNLANTDITWETTTVADAGIDVSVLGGKLNLVVDYFNRRTFDILYAVSTSSTLGLRPSETNAGEVSNRGWDFDVNHRNNFGQFTYSVSANFSVVKNKVVKLSNVDRDIARGLFVGRPLQSFYGYQAEGLFIDQADIDKYPVQPFLAEPGFVRYMDIAGPDGGPPDGVVDANNDRMPLGSSFPKYTYGSSITVGFKGFDLMAQLAGAGGMLRQIGQIQFKRAFQNDATPQRWMVEGRWTAENPDRNATYPKFSRALVGGSPVEPSSYWLINASYLKLKTLQIGYSISPDLLSRLRITRLRIYLNGSNLLAFHKFYKGWDPEPTTPGTFRQFYPFTSVYSAGINASF